VLADLSLQRHSRPETSRAESLTLPFLLAGAALLAALLLGPASIIFRHIPLLYNEGWNAYFDLRAVTPGAGPLYPPAGSLVFNNYPPLSFYLVGWLGLLTGDMIVAGRIVALAALLASGALLGLCVRRLGGDRRVSAATALLLLLFASGFFPRYLAMDDPQWLAHALMLAGLAVLLRGHRSGTLAAADIAVAALLMLAGGFVKHSLVALPLAITLGLLVSNRRAALIWLATAMLGLGAAAAAVAVTYGPVAFADVLNHPRIYSVYRMGEAFGRLIPMLPMVLIAAVVLRRERDPAVLLVVLFVAIAAVTGLAQRLGNGVSYNAHFETLIAACLAFGLALSRSARLAPAITPLLLTSLAAAPLLYALPGRLTDLRADLQYAPAREAAWQAVITRIASADGAAACETLALCYWAGKPFTLDMFNLTETVLVHGNSAGLQSLLDQHRLGILEYSPRSAIHIDAVLRAGHDPVMDPIRAATTPIATGPDGMVLLGPR
jgi:hypothetical protein